MTVPTTGRTGQIIVERADLDRLPVGSVVVPTWFGDRKHAGMHAAAKWHADCGRTEWYEIGRYEPIYPLGEVDDDYLPVGTIVRSPDTGIPADRNGLGVLVVYDPRDQL